SQCCQPTAARLAASDVHRGIRHSRQPAVSIHLSLPTTIPDPLELAREKGYHEIAELLIAAGA
ncbi:hypothetical protein NLN78_23280, partial [Citrobacter portucalensis]|nr:hypothetical protein [Citrobacter portucalensis]